VIFIGLGGGAFAITASLVSGARIIARTAIIAIAF
jgi:hypothetical protein